MKQYFNFGEVLGYFFRSKDAQRPTNFNLKSMHFINKLSMVMFLIGVSVLIYRLLIR